MFLECQYSSFAGILRSLEKSETPAATFKIMSSVINNVVSISSGNGCFTGSGVYYKDGIFITNSHVILRPGQVQRYIDDDGNEAVYQNIDSKFEMIEFLGGYEKEDVEDDVQFCIHDEWATTTRFLNCFDSAMFSVTGLSVPENVAPIDIEFDLDVISKHKYLYVYYRHLGKKELTRVYNSFYAIRLAKSGEYTEEEKKELDEFLLYIGDPDEFVDRVFYMDNRSIHGDSGCPIFIKAEKYQLVGSVFGGAGDVSFGTALDKDFIERGLK